MRFARRHGFSSVIFYLAAACRSFAGRALANGHDLSDWRTGIVLRAPISSLPARLEFHRFDIGAGDDELAANATHGEGRHRRPPRPQSSSASRFTAGAAGFLLLSQCRERPDVWREPLRFDTMPSSPSLPGPCYSLRRRSQRRFCPENKFCCPKNTLRQIDRVALLKPCSRGLR
jgi:hypothetical protein